MRKTDVTYNDNGKKWQRVNSVVSCHFQNGETALHIAARHGQLKMVQALLHDGGDPMWQSKVTTSHCVAYDDVLPKGTRGTEGNDMREHMH